MLSTHSVPADFTSFQKADLKNGIRLISVAGHSTDYRTAAAFKDQALRAGYDVVLYDAFMASTSLRFIGVIMNDIAPRTFDLQKVVAELRRAEAHVRGIKITSAVERSLTKPSFAEDIPGWWLKSGYRSIECGSIHNPITAQDCTQLDSAKLYEIVETNLKRFPKVR